MSWQFGANYMYNKWNGTYKGKGDKAQKYPFEGIFVRETGANEFNRYVSENSSMYSYLSKSNNGASASSSLRGNTNDYGLASNTTVPENPVSFAISASIKPRIVTKGAIIVPAPAALSPTLPRAIDFKPVEPQIATVTPPTIVTPSINPPGTGNWDEAYIYNGSYNKLVGSNGSSDVAPISQAKMDGGTADITVTAANTAYGGSFRLKTNGVTFTGIEGSGHGTLFTYTNNLDETYASSYATFKLVGGHTIDITGTTINYSGAALSPAVSTTNSYRKWLFHTDGHNNRGESIWKLNGTTKVNISGDYLTMYTSQYHSGTTQNANIGFVNNATITEQGTSNIIWVGLTEGSNGSQGINRLQYFHNNTNGKLTMAGTGSTLAYIMIPTLSNISNNDEGGFAYQNDGEITMSGANQNGLIIAGSGDSNAGYYNKSEIRLVKPITIAGTNSNAIVFNVWADLDGGTTQFNRSSADNKDDGLGKTLEATSRESIINVNITGNNNRALYFNDTKTATTKTFTVNSYALNSTDAKNNILAYINKGTVTFGTTNVNAKNDMGRTPLAEALATCRNSNIVQAAEIAEMLIKAGAEVVPEMTERVEIIGKDFEFHRENFNKDYLAETEAGLEKLYTLFDVKPAPKRKIHDGVSPIIVKTGSWREQYDELWEMLIPSSGAAKTVQGEVIRITGRVQDELYRNGGVNWDKDYRNMLNTLPNHFASGTPLSEEELEETKELISSIRANGGDEDAITERLCELSVLWVLSNPTPIPLGKTNYNR